MRKSEYAENRTCPLFYKVLFYKVRFYKGTCSVRATELAFSQEKLSENNIGVDGRENGRQQASMWEAADRRRMLGLLYKLLGMV